MWSIHMIPRTISPRMKFQTAMKTPITTRRPSTTCVWEISSCRVGQVVFRISTITSWRYFLARGMGPVDDAPPGPPVRVGAAVGLTRSFAGFTVTALLSVAMMVPSFRPDPTRWATALRIPDLPPAGRARDSGGGRASAPVVERFGETGDWPAPQLL